MSRGWLLAKLHRKLIVLALGMLVGACQPAAGPATGTPQAGSPSSAPTTTVVAGASQPSDDASHSPATSTAKVIAIAVDDTTACELHAVGTVACWDQDDPTPVIVPGVTGAVAISTTGWVTCVLTLDGGAQCWG